MRFETLDYVKWSQISCVFVVLRETERFYEWASSKQVLGKTCRISLPNDNEIRRWTLAQPRNNLIAKMMSDFKHTQCESMWVWADYGQMAYFTSCKRLIFIDQLHLLLLLLCHYHWNYDADNYFAQKHNLNLNETADISCAPINRSQATHTFQRHWQQQQQQLRLCYVSAILLHS